MDYNFINDQNLREKLLKARSKRDLIDDEIKLIPEKISANSISGDKYSTNKIQSKNKAVKKTYKTKVRKVKELVKTNEIYSVKDALESLSKGNLIRSTVFFLEKSFILFFFTGLFFSSFTCSSFLETKMGISSGTSDSGSIISRGGGKSSFSNFLTSNLYLENVI